MSINKKLKESMIFGYERDHIHALTFWYPEDINLVYDLRVKKSTDN